MSSADAPKRPVKAFQFIQGKPNVDQLQDETNKENRPLPQSPEKQSARQDNPVTVSPSKFPSTPASRLPLADLIGDADEDFNPQTVQHPQPEDRISWKVGPSPRSTDSSKVTSGPHARKRARSSSPDSASQSSAKRLRPTLRALGQPLKTPGRAQNADLWERYGATLDNPTGLTKPLAALLESSSPYADGTGNVGGLRRWTSCGIEWPSSKRKKKAAVPSAVNNLQDVFTDFQEENEEEEQTGPKRPKHTRMSSLLAKIKDSLAQPLPSRHDQDGPSSSSPGPDKVEQFDRQSISPYRAPEIAADRNDHSPTSIRQRPSSQKTPQLDSATTSFGSGDADDAAWSGALANIDTGKQTNDPAQGQNHDRQDPNHRSEVDFDDDDFDFSAEDFDSMNLAQDSIASKPSIPKDETPTTKEPDYGEDEDVDEDLFAAAEASATQATSAAARQSGSVKPQKSAKIQRYRVNEVFSGQYTDKQGRQRPEQVVSVADEESKLAKTIILRESWIDTRCTRGSYVHIVGSFDRHGHCVVDDVHNILILHPDHLISALTVADSFSCIRKAVLQDRIKATSEASGPMLYGTIIHEIIQEALQANRWDDAFLQERVDALVQRHLEDLFNAKLTVPQATDHLYGKLGAIQSWSETFIKLLPDQESMVNDMRGERSRLSINKVLDVEEQIWSPMYGLKGNIDATVQVAVEDEQGSRTLTVPLELKTGAREMASHRAQTALYTLMLSDRYDISVVYGILFYLESGQMSRIPAIRHELRHLIMQRNELACYVRERLSLPPMIRNTHTCNSCYAKAPCFLYHRLAEDGDGDTSGLRDKFDALTKHLQPHHQAFFKNWDDLLTKEESEVMKFRRELWTMLSKEREKLGRCFANVTLLPSATSVDPGTSKINRFSYTFKKHDETVPFSFSESHMSVGEPIVVSDESGHYALARGYVTSISRSRVTVAVDRRLHNARAREAGFDEESRQTFAGLMSLDGPRDLVSTSPSSLQYRIDKDEFMNGMASTRNNLIELMRHDAFRSRALRELIIEKQAPRFKPLPSSYTLSGPASQSSINADQRGAIEKILCAQDYALVLGMPGTGKTTTIAHIIRALVAKGKSVLLASYTHTAVDNILLKLKSSKTPVLRVGALAKIHPEVREFALLAEQPSESIEELHAKWHDPQVVAATCLGVSHPIFQQRIFDYCIVDEASQITLPVCLGPIRMAKTFVLVGDHHQLPPLVQNDEAKKGGLDVSLFMELSEAHPGAVATLSEQYRMNEEIMSLSSRLIYNGMLKCGSVEVARQRLHLPHFNALTAFHSASSSSSSQSACPSLASPACFLASTLAPSSSPVTFLNTDTLLPASQEIKHGPRITNPLESTMVCLLVRALLATGVAPAAIGVITLYRSQLSLIKQDLQQTLGASAAAQIEAHTADKYQGRDKEAVLVSFVRSNPARELGELLRDRRRVNVALTRAKRKLVLVASRTTVAADPLLAALVALCADRGHLLDVPASWPHPLSATQAVPPHTAPPAAEVAAADACAAAAEGQCLTRTPLATKATNPTANAPDTKACVNGEKNPAGSKKTPARTIRGQKRLTHGLLERRRGGGSVLGDVVRDVVGDLD